MSTMEYIPIRGHHLYHLTDYVFRKSTRRLKHRYGPAFAELAEQRYSKILNQESGIQVVRGVDFLCSPPRSEICKSCPDRDGPEAITPANLFDDLVRHIYRMRRDTNYDPEPALQHLRSVRSKLRDHNLPVGSLGQTLFLSPEGIVEMFPHMAPILESAEFAASIDDPQYENLLALQHLLDQHEPRRLEGDIVEIKATK